MLQQKKYDEALKYFAAAARTDAKDAVAYKGLGYAYAYKNDRVKALEYLRYALKLEPENAELTSYVSQLEGAGESQVQPSKTQTEFPETPSSHPWLMGGIVAVLGSLMLAAF
jgi:tetratricopeptide (TPR) repeat protein